MVSLTSALIDTTAALRTGANTRIWSNWQNSLGDQTSICEMGFASQIEPLKKGTINLHKFAQFFFVSLRDSSV